MKLQSSVSTVDRDFKKDFFSDQYRNIFINAEMLQTHLGYDFQISSNNTTESSSNNEFEKSPLQTLDIFLIEKFHSSSCVGHIPLDMKLHMN